MLRSVPSDRIDDELINKLVDSFYKKIAVDEQLGPIFRFHIAGDWDTHLSTMKRFWSSVLLHSGQYKGQPVAVHNKISGIRTEDFIQWINLFDETLGELCCPDVALEIGKVARRIANSLWLAKFGKPDSDPLIA